MGPLILHSHNMSGGVAERYCSSLLASRRFTRGWGFESLRLRIGQQPHPWQLWCNGNTVDRGSAIDGSIPSSCPKALVAQWIAHQFPEQGVAGSSPAKGARAMPQTPVAQRIECQLTKLKVGVRFSPGVLRARQPAYLNGESAGFLNRRVWVRIPPWAPPWAQIDPPGAQRFSNVGLAQQARAPALYPGGAGSSPASGSTFRLRCSTD